MQRSKSHRPTSILYSIDLAQIAEGAHDEGASELRVEELLQSGADE